MNAFPNPRNGASFINIVDDTAHSVSFFQENEQPKYINEVVLPQARISIAEPIDVQMDELGNSITQVYHSIGIISDEKVPGLGSILNYMKLFSKDDPAINEHHYHIANKQYNKETHNIRIQYR